MRMLLDTGTTMNSGCLTYQLWVMSQCTDMVGVFIQGCDGTGYGVVQPLDHGKMTAAIRYKTPYFINKRDPLFISFALGNDVFLRCVLGYQLC